MCGVDDGARSLEESLAIARAASHAGIAVVIATPHVRSGRGALDVLSLAGRIGALNEALGAAGIAVRVEPGGEVDVSRLATLAADELDAVGLAGTAFVLVETPYGHDPVAPSYELLLRHAMSGGVKPILAHPERNPRLATVELLRRLVDHGALVQITAASLVGQFGAPARRHALELIRLGLAHAIASDAHDTGSRLAAFAELARDGGAAADLGLAERISSLIHVTPAALLAGDELRGALPALPPVRGSRWRRSLQDVFTRR